MGIPSRTRIVSLFLKSIVIVSAAVGIFLSARSARNTFMGGSRVLMFFTIQSNIAIALISLFGAVLLFRRPPGGAWPVIKLAGTVSITLTGTVFTFMLAPVLGTRAWSVSNTLTHVVVPATAIIDFLVIGAYFDIPKKNVFWVLLPPAAYVVYAAIGYVNGWEFMDGVNYPYFFLNWGSPLGAFGFSNEWPFMGCVWWILVLLAFLLAVGRIDLLITGRIRNKRLASQQTDHQA